MPRQDSARMAARALATSWLWSLGRTLSPKRPILLRADPRAVRAQGTQRCPAQVEVSRRRNLGCPPRIGVEHRAAIG